MSGNRLLNDEEEDLSDEGDSDYAPSEDDDDEIEESPTKIQKKKKKGRRNRAESSSDDDQDEIGEDELLENDDQVKENSPKPDPTNSCDESEKKRLDDMFADFLAEVEGTPSNKPTETNIKSSDEIPSTSKEVAQPEPLKPEKEKVTVTEIFDFAGEEVRVEKMVDAPQSSSSVDKKKPDLLKRKLPPKGGISNLLQSIKKPKMSTLEKSKFDWNSFKDKEGIHDELETFNKGKDGYLNKQEFLQRTDVKQFEYERKIRQISRKNV